MPLLRKQPFVKAVPPPGLAPDAEVFYCETTGEVFTEYEAFFERTILCNSLVWSCSVTGKSGLTYEEAAESEARSRKKISGLPKALKRGLVYLASKTKRGRLGEVGDDVYDWAKSRHFKGEVVDAVIGNQWCESRILRVIAPTPEEVAAEGAATQEEVVEVRADGSPVKEKVKVAAVPDHLFKYEVEETEPDDEDMVELHTIEADDIKREKGLFTREKLNLYLKNVMELEGQVFKVKAKAAKMYSVSTLTIESVFAGPEPEFEESLRKIAAVMSKKKGQCTLDGWATSTAAKTDKKEGKAKEPKEAKVTKPKKQTPQEIEEEMRKLREAQARWREEQERKKEEMKKKRIEERQKEKERKVEERRLVKELMEEWSARREDLECEDLRALPVPTPVRCRVPNRLAGEVLAILEFIHSFAEILEVKDSYPGQGVTFQELEKALTETETADGAFFDILSFMLVTVFDLQLEEEEEAKADTDKTWDDVTWAGDLGKDEVIAAQIHRATEVAAFTRQSLGCTLREVHLDQFSITEVLRLHLEGSGGYRGWNLQNWRHNNRGGYKLQDDPGFQFCLDEPQVVASLRERSVFELGVADKVKVLTCMVNQMLTFAGVRDELDERFETMWETHMELKACRAEENKRIKEHEMEEKKIAKEERVKLKEEKEEAIQKKKQGKNKALEERLKKEENQVEVKEPVKEEKEEKKPAGENAPRMTSRQLNLLKEKEKEKEASVLKEKEAEAERRDLGEEGRRGEFQERERSIQGRVRDFKDRFGLLCLGRDRAFRRFWVFDSAPGLFVEHDDCEVGVCGEVATPWDPSGAGPITEEEATRRARQILQEKAGEPLASPSSDKENQVTKSAKTYSKKNPVLVQKVLAFNKEDAKAEVKEEETKMEVEEGAEEEVAPWGRCLASGEECPVHSLILPRTHWAFYSTLAEVDSLVAALNPRGVREGELREQLLNQRERIERKMKKVQVGVLNRSEEDAARLEESMAAEVVRRRAKAAQVEALAAPLGTPMQELMELALRDQVLELEEKIFVGALGFLKAAKEPERRGEWRAALEARGYNMMAEAVEWGEGGRLEAAEVEGAAPQGEGAGGQAVRQLAAAILQVEQMIGKEDVEKYLQEPLGEGEKERKKRLKKEEEVKKKKQAAEEAGEELEEEEEAAADTPLKKWEMSLMACSSLSQLFVHLTTLDNSVVWSKSVMNTKCRICRRKTDPDRMLLCDGCDRGHHMYCLKPKVKKVPEGDWFCPECRPKERIRSPKKKVRNMFQEKEDEEEDEEEEEEEDETPAPSRKSRSRRKLAESEDEEEEAPKSKKDKSRSKKKAVESEEEDDEEASPPPKKGGKKSKKKAVEESEEDEEETSPPPKKGKGKKEDKRKSGLANLFGRRQAAVKSDERRRGEEIEEEEEEKDEEVSPPSNKGGRKARKKGEESEEEEEPRGRAARRARKSQDSQENKENSRSKRSRRGEEEEADLDLNAGEMVELVKGLMAHKDGWPFDRPIRKADAPDYHLCVKTPMDLDTIRTRLDGTTHYTRNQQILDDIRLVFSNCIQYNEEDTEEYQCAVRLEKHFDKELRRVGLVDESSFPKVPKAKKRRT